MLGATEIAPMIAGSTRASHSHWVAKPYPRPIAQIRVPALCGDKPRLSWVATELMVGLGLAAIAGTILLAIEADFQRPAMPMPGGCASMAPST